MKRIFENLKVAFKSINSNKLRTFLTMLGIIIGVGAVVAVMSVGAGAEATITANLTEYGHKCNYYFTRERNTGWWRRSDEGIWQ